MTIPIAKQQLITKCNRELKNIDLCNYGLCSRDMESLKNLLNKNENIISINLEYNNIGSVGVTYIAQMIYVQQINLNSNKLGDIGVNKLANEIK